MFDYDKKAVVLIAKANNFLVNNTEKVLRLSKILTFIYNSEFGKYLSLKGGTAINLFILDLPRLSVDIDYDFSFNCSKEEMTIIRDKIRNIINGYMSNEGYFLSNNSKYTHTLDSFVFQYNTTSGSKDNLKIEINYSNRIHILNIDTKSKFIKLGEAVSTNVLSDEELIGSKINALIMRTTPRDVYDTYNLLKLGIGDLNLIKKIAIFYAVLSSEIPVDFDELVNKCVTNIDKINYNKLRESVIPLLHMGEKINIGELKEFVSSNIKELFTLNDNEQRYIDEFNKGNINPELLFEEYKINDIKNHPMVLWKIMNNNK